MINAELKDERQTANFRLRMAHRALAEANQSPAPDEDVDCATLERSCRRAGKYDSVAFMSEAPDPPGAHLRAADQAPGNARAVTSKGAGRKPATPREVLGRQQNGLGNETATRRSLRDSSAGSCGRPGRNR